MVKKINPLRANTFRQESKGEEPEIPDLRKPEKPEKPAKKRKPEKPAKPKKEKKVRKPLDERYLRVIGLFFLLFSLYLLLAFVSYTLTWKADFDFSNKVFSNFTLNHFLESKTPENWVGKIGALTAYLFISEWFGVASFLFVAIFFITGMKFLLRITLFPLVRTLKYSFFGIVWTPVALSVIFPGEDVLYGVYGFELNKILQDFLGYSGLIIILGFIFLSFLIISFNIPFRWMKKKEIIEIPVSEVQPEKIEENRVPEPDLEFVQEEKSDGNRFMPKADPDPEEAVTTELEVEQETKPAAEKLPESSSIELQIEKPVEEPVADTGDAGEKVHFGLDTKYDPTLDLPNYKFPDTDLLKDYGGDEINVNKEELEANKNRIVQTLNNYSIKIDKIKATIGPAVTLYEIVPEAGVRISKIKNLEDDIALSLSALGIRIIAPIPGKGTIGIEVPNKNPEIVSMKSLLASERFQKTTFELPLVLGKTISNETFIVDLAKMPHILMAGATGQGKSVGLNTIITSLLYKKHPSQIKFVMVDPKKVELSLFSKIERHFLAKLPDSEEAIITDTKKVIRTLNSLNIEMDSRYDLLQNAQVRNIKEYNEKFIARKLNPEHDHHFLPYLILVVDEFADLIMTAGREIETPLTRLAQLARAVGIHLVIATQRPSVNIITGTIKANFPARIAFRVISKIDSRTILDTGGADQLVGRGDMLLSTGSDLIRLQCAFVDTPEIEKLTDFIGSQRGFSDAFHLPEFNEDEPEGNREIDPDSRDALFAEAARLIVQNQQGSTSLIQRKLKLGYNRAGRIIDQLESAGIVGPFEGSKARDVRFKDLTQLEIHLRDLGEI
ncbi:MAG: DNA translocase FtsK 4TM domain-containing protein [Bacteroidetes bacterium]|nr:DNA translocase FtsK 4TM domain-containing protein [Bacteroidota bacterium]